MAASGVVAALGASGCTDQGASAALRQIFYNGKVYTAQEGQEATAFVVEDGKFLFVGSDDEATQLAGAKGTLIDLEGRRVIPGLIDTHSHYLGLCSLDLLGLVQIDQTLSHDEVLALITETARDNPLDDLPVIVGMGFGVDCIPLAAELDRACDDRPVLLADSGGHSGWSNTKMIEMAGLDANTPDPKPGFSFYERDGAGNLTGRVVETDALTHLLMVSGAALPENIVLQLPYMIKALHSFGYTAVFDAGLLFVQESAAYAALKNLDSTLQVYCSFLFKGDPPVEEFFATMVRAREQFGSSWLHPTTLKMFKDGTLEAQSAWLSEEYLAPGSGFGGEVLTNELMVEMAKRAGADGFNVHVHAIGDRAIDETLTVYEALGAIDGTKTMAHVQVMPPGGIERFAAQPDVIIQTTPVWLRQDEYTWQVLGRERALRQMPLRSALAGGTLITFGSDAPVSGGLDGVNPFNNMHCAVNRSFDTETYFPPQSEGIDISSCIDAYTINGAKQLRAEHSFGSITEGKMANFVILDQDILKMPPKTIRDANALQTWVQGQCVYDATDPLTMLVEFIVTKLIL
jgi:predicted amidohydrolase YtcJ